MRRARFLLLTPLVLLPGAALGQVAKGDPDPIQSALSAAPASLAGGATVTDQHGTTLRQGTNGWVCMPDDPTVPNNTPMCLDQPWVEFMGAFMNKREPRFQSLGVGYMLQEDFPVSNTNPFDTAPAPENQWVANGGPHIMIIVPDQGLLQGMSTDPSNGGPWVMWKGTPYAHVMIPAPRRE